MPSRSNSIGVAALFDRRIARGDVDACVIGALRDGTPIEGCDTVVTVLPVKIWSADPARIDASI